MVNKSSDVVFSIDMYPPGAVKAVERRRCGCTDQLVLQGEMTKLRLESIPDITKTRLYNFDPLKPHFYIVKLGFTGVYIIFLILLKKN